MRSLGRRAIGIALLTALAISMALGACSAQPAEDVESDLIVTEAPVEELAAEAEAITSAEAAGTESAVERETIEDSAAETPIEGGTELAGTWAPVAEVYQGETLSFSDHATLADLFDNTFITFSASGKFAYKKNLVYIDRGVWTHFQDEGDMQGYYLKTSSTAKVTLDSGWGGQDIGNTQGTVYIAVLSGDDQPYLLIHEQGDEVEDMHLIFTRTNDAIEIPLEASKPADESSSSASPSTSGSPSPSSSPSKPSSSSSPADDLKLVDEFETSNGIGYQGSDGNYYFINDDGTIEATDGWGNGVRDVNGDGEPDYYTTDGGETWIEM